MSGLKEFKATSEHDGGEWYDFKTWDASDAAEEYAESADCSSGGEFEDGTVVTVKEGEDGEPQAFVISVNHEKTFSASPK